MLNTLGSQNVLIGTLNHDALRASTIHPTELSINGVTLFVNICISTIPLPHSMTLLPIVRTNGSIITFATLGLKNKTRNYGIMLSVT